MRALIKMISIASCLALSGCAGVPLLGPVPEVAKNEGVVLFHSPLLDETSHMTKHLNKDKNIIYFQNFGGGGLALGLLAGPIGVAANMKMIEGNTDSDIKMFSDRIDVDPVGVFIEAAAESNYPIGSDAQGGAAKLSPYLYVVKAQEDKLLVAAAIIVDVDMAEKKWTGRYIYQLPLTYTVEEMAKADKQASSEINRNVLVGFSELIKMFKAESPEAVKNEKEISFKSDFIVPRFTYELPGSLVADSQDRAWIRTVDTVYSLSKSEVKLFER